MAVSHVAPGDVTTLHIAVPQTLSVADVVCLEHVKSTANSRESLNCSFRFCGGYSEDNSRITLAFRCSCGGLLPLIGAPALELEAILSCPSAWNEAVNKFKRFRRDQKADGILGSTTGCCRCQQYDSADSEPELLVLGAMCDSGCGSFVVASHLYDNSEVLPVSLNALQLRDTATSAVDSDSLQLLCMLGGSTALCHLQHLGLHDLALSLPVARSLGHIFQALSHRMTALTMVFVRDSIGEGVIPPSSLKDSVHPQPQTGYIPTSVAASTKTQAQTNAGRLTPLEKTLFFKAVAQLHSLKELHIPQWDVLVGKDARACIEPLRQLSELKTVHVSTLRGKEALQAWSGLQFITPP